MDMGNSLRTADVVCLVILVVMVVSLLKQCLCAFNLSLQMMISGRQVVSYS